MKNQLRWGLNRSRGERTVGGPVPLSDSAGALGWRVDEDLREMLAALDARLRGRRPPRVAVVSDVASQEWRRLIKSSYPRARVVMVDTSVREATSHHAELAAWGRYDAIIADRCGGPESPAVLREAVFHLKTSGRLYVRLEGEASEYRRRENVEALRSALNRTSFPGGGGREEQEGQVLADAVELVASQGHLVASLKNQAVAKLREDEMDVVLLARPRTGSVVATLPAVEFASRCVLHESVSERDPGMPEKFWVPDMRLREYRDVVCHRHQIAMQRNVVLPDSFRFNAAPYLRNAHLVDVQPGFAEIKDTRRPRQLEGDYFYLDSEWTPHFGHVVSEQMSRLWGVAQAREHWPDLKALLSRRRGHAHVLTAYEEAVFGAFGFTDSDVRFFDRPVRVERLVAATPMMSGADVLLRGELRRHVHPELAGVWRQVGDAVVATASGRPHPRRFFCSRRREDRRMCGNKREVEDLFAANGFTVLYPEDLPFPEQVALFRSAEVVAGFSGSALFNAVFCERPVRMIVVGPTTYLARNEYMICSVLGHELHYFWSQPDPEDAQGPTPQYSGFSVDLAREGAALRDLLGSL